MDNKINMTKIIVVDFKRKKATGVYQFNYESETVIYESYENEKNWICDFEDYQKMYDEKHGKAS